MNTSRIARKFLKASLGLAAAGLLGSAALPLTAHAAIINSDLGVGLNEFEDTDAERVLRGGSAVTSGLLAPGDILQTILRFNTVNSTQIVAFPATPFPYQLTAFCELQVLSISNCGVDTRCDLVFTPSGNLGANVFASLYENAAGTLTGLSDPAATGIAKATSGNLITTLGLGEADDFSGYASIAKPT